MVIGSRKGEYDKFIIKFKKDFSSYTIRHVKNVAYTGINFVVLDKGIVVHINEDENLEVFSNSTSTGCMVIASKSLSSTTPSRSFSTRLDILAVKVISSPSLRNRGALGTTISCFWVTSSF